MNLTGIIFGIALSSMYLYLFLEVIKTRRVAKQVTGSATAWTVALIIMILIPVLLIVSVLNLYGIGRIPVFNEMRSSIPQSYNPPDKPVKPPVAGSTQPSSQPAFDEHKAQMEKLKKDGF